ncbi:MAG: sensor histidine kinase [Myxococcota bacterium]|nr:sensor histidine kinase [Myxococcota bacterium]
MTIGLTHVVAGLAVLLEIGCAIAVLRLIRITASRRAWGLIAAGIGLMAVRHALTLASYTDDPGGLASHLGEELLSLFMWLLVFAGLITLPPVFQSLRDSQDAAQAARDLATERAEELEAANEQLSREVGERTQAEDLIAAHADTLSWSLAELASGTPLDQFLRTLLPMVVERMGGVEGAIWLRDESDGTVRMVLEYGPDGTHGPDDSDHPRAPGLDRGGKPWRPTDEEVNRLVSIWRAGDSESWMTDAEKEFLAARGIKKVIFAPMVAGDVAVGWFAIRFSCSEDPDKEAELAEALVRQATLAVVLERASRKVQETTILSERNRMAREIHDTLAQAFTGTLMQLEAARAVAPELPAAVDERLDRIQQLARDGLVEARRSVWALRPVAMDGRNLLDGLVHLAAEAERGHAGPVRVRVESHGDVDAIPLDLQGELLRIAQECIGNALQHARPSEVSVRLVVAGDAAQLVVSDDGVGVREASRASHGAGFGLIGMQERAAQIDAKLEILDLGTETGGERQGTRVSCDVPLRRTR